MKNDFKIIPAIDILNGQCVRLKQGNYQDVKSYSDSPLDMAIAFEQAGVQYLHIVDLDAAKSGHPTNTDIIESICQNTQLTIDYGGGIRTIKDIEKMIDAGVDQITLGSIAIHSPMIVKEAIEAFGAEKFILGADCKDGLIATHGWLQSNETPVLNLILDYAKLGLDTCIVTDISKDGMLQGPAIELYQSIIAESNINLIASGGVSSYEDLNKLKDIGCQGAIVGKALYEGKIKLEQIV